ncbi:MAG: GrpB family protein [Opitutae bacterium]|nr:GrpB family protein [Opitutae bacterium]
MRPVPPSVGQIERVRLVTVALLGEAIVSVMLAKIDLLQKGTPARADCWMLDGIHRVMLQAVERMQQNTTGWEQLALDDRRHGGVSNTEVVLRGSDPAWSEDARREAEMLQAALGPAVEVHHIGSTAVADLTSKPIIDLAVALPTPRFSQTFAGAKSTLHNLGYRYIGVRGGFFFEKGPAASVRTHALQVHTTDSAVLAMLLRFRDELRKDGELRREYAAAKAAIARHLPRRRWIYAIYKGHWIQEQIWRGLGARSWADWFVAHQRAQVKLAKASQGAA